MKKKTLCLAALTLGLFSFTSLAQANEFPVTFKHEFGTTVVEKKPVRIATLDYSGADDLLALGVQPLTVRDRQGRQARGVWVWSEPYLKGNPAIIKGTIDFELLAAQKPDVIIAMWSGITAADYEKLSKIAPVVAKPDGLGDKPVPWDRRAILTGKAVGLEELAQEKVQEISDKFASFRAKHPNWANKTYTVAYANKGAPGGMAPGDPRAEFIRKLGFKFNEKLLPYTKPGVFYTSLSEEQINVIDSDLIVWFSRHGKAEIEALPGRKFLNAYKEGHEVFLDRLSAAAFTYSSLLSIPFAFDKITKDIEEALADK